MFWKNQSLLALSISPYPGSCDRRASTTTTTIMSLSPPAKRMRLSSPTFDDQVGELSQDDILAFDSLDAQLSQSFVAPVDDDENPFNPRQTTQSERIYAPFKSASAIDSSSEVDHAAWFNPSSFVGFNAATTAMPGFHRPSTKDENPKSLFIPSAAALREAEEKMKKWQEEVHLPDNEPDSHPSTQIVSPPRATFSSARNAHPSVQAPETPTPASLFRSANAEPTPSRSHSALQSLGSKRQTKPFKSPFISAMTSMPSHPQVSAPSINSPLPGYHPSATVPSQFAPAVSPLRPSLVANRAATQKPLGFTPRHGSASTRPKFVTPFKTAMKSDTPTTFILENRKLPPTPSHPRAIMNRVYPPSVSSSPRPTKRNSSGIFNLGEYSCEFLIPLPGA